MRLIFRVVAVCVLGGVACTLAGCNTFAGIGEDITDSARAVQRAM
jgi:predicted small secreted protein